MSEPLKLGKYYLNKVTGQAVGMLQKVETVSWGKIWVVELATPSQVGMLFPMAPDVQDTVWHEITKDEFKKLQVECVRVALDLAVKPKKVSWKEKLSAWWTRNVVADRDEEREIEEDIKRMFKEQDKNSLQKKSETPASPARSNT